MKVIKVLSLALMFVIACGSEIAWAGKTSSGSKSFSGGFKSTPKPTSTSNKPSYTVTKTSDSRSDSAKVSSTTATKYGSFGGSQKPEPVKATNSAGFNELNKVQAQSNALKNLDARKVAAAGVVGAGVAAATMGQSAEKTEPTAMNSENNSKFDTSGVEDRFQKQNYQQYKQQPQTIVVEKSDSLMPAAIGYMAGRAMANSEQHSRANDRDIVNRNPIVEDTKVIEPSARTEVETQSISTVANKGVKSEDDESVGFFTLLFWVIAGGLVIWIAFKFLNIGKDDSNAISTKSKPNYSLGGK